MTNIRRFRPIPLTCAVAFAFALAAPARRAFAEAASGTARETQRVERVPAPRLNLTVLGGVALPICVGQQGCDGDLGAGPSLGGVVLYEPNDRWSFGLSAQVAHVHWRESYLGMIDGATHPISSDLTTGMAALAVRYAPLPELRVSPLVQVALGSSFQTQTGSNFNCNGGFIPTGQVGLGGRARLFTSTSAFALASATWGLKNTCGVSDGPAATPFAGWGVGLQAGASFDVGLGRSATALARR
jgi:hypothetical protein